MVDCIGVARTPPKKKKTKKNTHTHKHLRWSCKDLYLDACGSPFYDPGLYELSFLLLMTNFTLADLTMGTTEPIFSLVVIPSLTGL